MPDAPSAGPDPHRHDEYFKQLGLFVSVFARTEAVLFYCLLVTSGVRVEIGKVIYSGTRAKEACASMRRIFVVKEFPAEIKNLMKACFDQVGAITEVRNHIIHYGAEFAEQSLRSTNKLRAASEDREVSFHLSPEFLHDMTLDLTQINRALGYCADVLIDRPGRTLPPAVAQVEQRSWRYKRPGPAATGRKPPRSAPKPQRPPPPSLG